MLSRIGGAVLLAVGLALAVGLLGGVVTGVAGVVALAIKVLIVSGVTYGGWRWLHHSSSLAKVAGAFLLVAGTAFSLPLMGEILAGAFGLVGTLIKVALTAGLIYVGWGWLGGRRDTSGSLSRGW